MVAGSIKRFFARNLEKQNEEYWKLSSYDERVRDYSHWSGYGRWGRERWLEYGALNWALARKTAADCAPEFLEGIEKKTALEWGCGGGANVLHLCRNFAKVYGVEISEPTIRECDKQMRSEGLNNFEPILVSAPEPESAFVDRAGPSVDFIMSIAVFQHFPSQAYTERVLRLMYRLSRAGALSFIEIRYDDGSSKWKQKEDDYARNMIGMTSFGAGAFVRMASSCGYLSLWSGRDMIKPGENHEYHLLRKPC